MSARRLIDKDGHIRQKATAQDLETICTDPSYAPYMDQVIGHPSCWDELARWVEERQSNPFATGAPPLPPDGVSDNRPNRLAKWRRPLNAHHGSMAIGLNRTVAKRALVLGAAALLVVVMGFTAAGHFSPFASAEAGSTDQDHSSSIPSDIMQDAHEAEERARKSPVYDKQLQVMVKDMDDAIKDGDRDKAQELTQKVDDMRMQKSRVRIGDVSSKLSDSIDRSASLRDVPDSAAKRRMIDLTEKWAGKSVDDDNLAQAQQDADSLAKAVSDCQNVKDRMDREAKEKAEQEAKKREAQQQQEQKRSTAQNESGAAGQQNNAIPQQQYTPAPQTTQRPAPQPAPQPKSQTQPVPQGGADGTDGVAIG